MNWVLQSKLYKLPQLALAHRLQATRLFIDARVKWVRDPFLDAAVEKEKDLKPLCSLLHHILASPSLSLPLSSASLLHLPSSATTSTAASFFLKYPSVFTIFQPSPGLPLHVRLTPPALSVYRQESALHLSPPLRHSAAARLAKLLMLSGSSALPFHIIDKFWWDLGLPPNYVPDLLSDYPDYFNVRAVKDEATGKELLALELMSWRDELAMSAMQERVKDGDFNGKPGTGLTFSMNFPEDSTRRRGSRLGWINGRTYPTYRLMRMLSIWRPVVIRRRSGWWLSSTSCCGSSRRRRQNGTTCFAGGSIWVSEHGSRRYWLIIQASFTSPIS